MNSPIFASPPSRYPGCNITLGISHPITTSIPPPLKSLSTYDERVASLKPCLRFLETARHSKAVMAAAGFSGGGCDSDPNYMQCSTCSLLLYSGYFTPEPLKEHLQNAPHCPLAIKLQQEVESKKAAKLKVAEELKPKIESPSAPSVKPLSTYEERLATLANWGWRTSLGSSKETMSAAGFSGIEDNRFKARCTHCSLILSGTRNFPFKDHLKKSPQCPLILQLEKETPEGIKRAELEALEAAKPTPVAADLGYFDPTLLCDIQEFGLHHEAATFCQHWQSIRDQANYREADLVQLLHTCLRGPALTWYKQQRQSESETAKKSLSEWLEALATAFPAKPPVKSSIQTSSASPASSPLQYHSCLNCSASFSSLARLLQHTQEATCQKAVCKQCEGAFESKNKLHEHIRQHHVKPAKEMVKDASGRSSNREGDKSSPTTSTTTPTTSPKTTTKFSISRPVTPPELPRNAPLTPPATPPPSLRKSPTPMLRNQKPYLTIDDLHRMFAGKPRPFGLPQHQNRRPSPQSSGARPRQPRSPHTCQSRITTYFPPAANQKAPIGQGLKSPKPKSFQQHTPAEPLPLYRPALPEKSAFSPYKKPGFSHTSLQSRSSLLQSRSSFAWPLTSPSYFWPSHTSPPLLGSPPPDPHVCCTCFGRSSFRHGLFNYRRPSQQHPSNRRPIGGMG